jgi:predicted RNA-binding protein YlxR (DUF448 family)
MKKKCFSNQELPEPPTDMDAFANASDLHFAAVRAKTGRSYYVCRQILCILDDLK